MEQILKFDDEQRIVYGWASVVTAEGKPVIDLQGDIISPATMQKAVNEFMENVRVGKTMHVGEQTGTIVHSLFLTEELAKSLGLTTDREGWIVGYKVHDEDLWKRAKNGDFKGFSIGGKSLKRTIRHGD